MTDCLIKEFKTIAGLTGITSITTVFFGGGTPSLMRPVDVERLLLAVSSLAPSPTMEVTLECNPVPAAMKNLMDFRSAGVTRVSVGVQSLCEEELALLGRTHTVPEALHFVDEAGRLFPGNTSVDLLYGRPRQQPQQWLSELNKVLQMDTAHISLYELTLERGTRLFKDVQSGLETLPPQETVSGMYMDAVKVLKSAGLFRYEASNFARKGHECRHNLGYWRAAQYLGIGPVQGHTAGLT